MITAEEKRRVLLELAASVNTPREKEAQRYLCELLLKDTIGGKLYKYRRFDEKGHALDNLRNGTLHCSKPKEFNDPFDCKIGVTLSSLLEAMYPEEYNLLISVIEKLGQVVQSKIMIEECDYDEQRILGKLLNDWKTVISEDYPNNAGEQMGTLDENTLMLELLTVILSDEVFKNIWSNNSSVVQNVVPKILPDGVPAFLKENTADADEISLMVNSCKTIFPDYVVDLDNFQTLLEEMDCQINELMANTFLVGCLCTDFKNRLMWSHYANSHKGFCIEYDFSDIGTSVPAVLPLPIVYSEKRPIIPWKAAMNSASQNAAEATTQLILGVLTKDMVWAYENEWRVIYNSGGPTELKMPKITCVYLGASISEEDRAKILDCVGGRVPIKQMKMDRGTYTLHAEDVWV